MDIFCEHMIKKAKTTKDILAVCGIVFSGIAVSCVLLFLAVMLASAITFSVYVALEIVVWYAVYIFVSRRNIEYEFTLTNGELEVDVIYSKKRRVHMLTARVKDFSVCAPMYDKKYENDFKNINEIKKIYSAHSFANKDDVYFADFYLNAQKVRLIFEPSLNMIKKMKMYNERNIHLQERA